MSIVTWRESLIPRLPGAITAYIDEEILRVIEQFCRESTAWRDTLYGFNITALNREIPIINGDGLSTTVLGILRVYYDQRQLTNYSHTPWETTTSVPTGWSTKSGDPSTVVLSTIPSQAHTGLIDTWVYQMPKTPLTSLPDVILGEFWEIIFDGVLGRMFAQPDKPYTDVLTGGYHMTRYRTGTVKARDQANRGFTATAQNWVFHSFGR